MGHDIFYLYEKNISLFMITSLIRNFLDAHKDIFLLG